MIITWHNFNQSEMTRCGEPISFLRSHSDLGQWIARHFYINEWEVFGETRFKLNV
jgi:hypothetical protein